MISPDCDSDCRLLSAMLVKCGRLPMNNWGRRRSRSKVGCKGIGSYRSSFRSQRVSPAQVLAFVIALFVTTVPR